MENQPMSDITSDDKLWALLAYLPFVGWIIAIVALLMEDKKSRPFVRFHSVQGLVLAIINGVDRGCLKRVDHRCVHWYCRGDLYALHWL